MAQNPIVTIEMEDGGVIKSRAVPHRRAQHSQ